MMPGGLGVGIRQSRESAVVHPNGQVQPLGVGRRNLILIRVAKSGCLVDAGYRCRAVAGFRLAGSVGLDQLREVHP